MMFNLGLKVCIEKNYASHLGIEDEEYVQEGIKFSKDDSEIIKNSDYICIINSRNAVF